MKLSYKKSALKFKHPFTTSKGTKTQQPALLVELEFFGVRGYGEAPAIDYYHISVDKMIEDIEEANELLKNVLLRKSDELSGSCRDYLQYINDYLKSNQQTKFTNREIRKHLKLEPTKQKRFTKILMESYYIKRVQGTKARGYEYEIVSPDEYRQLQSKISNVLAENVGKVKQHLAQKEPKKKRAQNAAAVVQ